METQESQDVGDQPVQYVWHPAIEAVFWVIRWMVFAVSTGIVWEFLANASLRSDTVLARASVVALALPLLAIVVFLIDLFGSIAQHAWDNYTPRVARPIFAIAAIGFLTVSVPYVWFVFWLLDQAWPHVWSWLGSIRWDRTIGWSLSSDSKTWIFLAGITAAVLWYAYSMWRRDPFYSYRHTVDVLGFRKCIAGICLMAYLRTLVPRRGFFIHAPVVSWMLVFAGAILVHAAIPIRVFAVAIPILVLTIMMPMWAGVLAPPLWIFLGKSDVDGFRMFYELRAEWRRHGLTLLDRTNPGGLEFYNSWRSSLRSSAPYDPGIGRIWSLRTRPQLWRTAVRLLAAFVPVIVVDWREPTEIVQSEVQWLERRNFLDKLYMVVSSEHTTGAESTGVPRLVDEEALKSSRWDRAGSLVFSKA